MLAIIISPFYVLLNGFILYRLLTYFGALHEKTKHPVIKWSFITVYTFFMLTPLTGFLIQKDPWHHMLKSMSNYWLGVLMIGTVTLLSSEILRFILNRTIWKDDHPNEKRFKIAGTCALLIILLVSSYGFLHYKNVQTTFETIDIDKNISVAKHGNLRVALIADTHIGYSVGEQQIQKIVNKVNESNVDLVIYAGDIFDNEYKAIKNPEKITKILSSMKSKYGTYACWGNHDIAEALLAGFTWDEEESRYDERFAEFLKASNITLLEDETILIDDSFYIIGRRDPSMSEKLNHERKSIEELTANLDKSKPIFVIDHQPSELEQLADAGVDVDFSGHTHYGQITPGNFTIHIGWDNPYGVEKIDNMYSIVTSGAGVWGPAMRLGTDSEVMIVDIR